MALSFHLFHFFFFSGWGWANSVAVIVQCNFGSFARIEDGDDGEDVSNLHI